MASTGGDALVDQPPTDGVVYVSGTLASDKENSIVDVGNAAAQKRHVLETIKSVIETAGGTMGDVTFYFIFIRDRANYAALNKVYMPNIFQETSRLGFHPVRIGEAGRAR